MRAKTDSKIRCVTVMHPASDYYSSETGQGKVMDKRTFIGMVEAGEPLIQQAIDAMREYHQAQDRGAPAAEIERLRVLAESLFQVVSDYQLRVIATMRGKDFPPLH